MESINKGIPVSQVNSSSNIASSFRDFAIKISDETIDKVMNKLKEL